MFTVARRDKLIFQTASELRTLKSTPVKQFSDEAVHDLVLARNLLRGLNTRIQHERTE